MNGADLKNKNNRFPFWQIKDNRKNGAKQSKCVACLLPCNDNYAVAFPWAVLFLD